VVLISHLRIIVGSTRIYVLLEFHVGVPVDIQSVCIDVVHSLLDNFFGVVGIPPSCKGQLYAASPVYLDGSIRHLSQVLGVGIVLLTGG
jgi:hypothetical protein